MGSAFSLLLAIRVYRASSAIANFPLKLLAVGLAVFSVGLILDSAAAVAAPASIHAPRVPHGRRPEEISILLVNRPAMLSQPLYMISYTLYAASIYGEHVDVERKSLKLYGLPLLAAVFIDYNVVSLVLLAIVAILVYARRGFGSWTLFYVLLVASHILAIIAVAMVNASLLSASTMLRAVAPVAAAVRGYKS